jgi:hypothetical protein
LPNLQQQQQMLKCVQINEGVAVWGEDTFKHKTDLKAIGGAQWNSNLKAWTFDKDQFSKVQAMVDSINNKRKPAPQKAPDDATSKHVHKKRKLEVTTQSTCFSSSLAQSKDAKSEKTKQEDSDVEMQQVQAQSLDSCFHLLSRSSTIPQAVVQEHQIHQQKAGLTANHL